MLMIRPFVQFNIPAIKRLKCNRRVLLPILCKYNRFHYTTHKIQRAIVKVGVSADPTRLQELTRVHYHPWKVLIRDIYPSLNEFDIESAILEVCNNVSITDVEIFHVKIRDALRKFAFVSFATQDDMNYVNNLAINGNRIEKLGNISTISNIDHERTLLMHFPPDINKEKDILTILESLSVQKRNIEQIHIQKTSPRITIVNVRFYKHEHAFITWQKIKDANMRDLRANWFERIDSVKRNNIISYYSNYLQLKKLEIENMLVEESVDNTTNTETNDYRLNKAMYDHVIKTLEYTNYDKKRAIELLKISSQKFTWIIKSLKEDGFEINI